MEDGLCYTSTSKNSKANLSKYQPISLLSVVAIVNQQLKRATFFKPISDLLDSLDSDQDTAQDQRCNNSLDLREEVCFIALDIEVQSKKV